MDKFRRLDYKSVPGISESINNLTQVVDNMDYRICSLTNEYGIMNGEGVPFKIFDVKEDTIKLKTRDG